MENTIWGPVPNRSLTTPSPPGLRSRSSSHPCRHSDGDESPPSVRKAVPLLPFGMETEHTPPPIFIQPRGLQTYKWPRPPSSFSMSHGPSSEVIIFQRKPHIQRSCAGGCSQNIVDKNQEIWKPEKDPRGSADLTLRTSAFNTAYTSYKSSWQRQLLHYCWLIVVAVGVKLFSLVRPPRSDVFSFFTTLRMIRNSLGSSLLNKEDTEGLSSHVAEHKDIPDAGDKQWVTTIH